MPDHDISPFSSPLQGWELCCTLRWGKYPPPNLVSSLGTLVTHSNRMAASAKNFLSKSQRKKRSRLGRGGRRAAHTPLMAMARVPGFPKDAVGTSDGS